MALEQLGIRTVGERLLGKAEDCIVHEIGLLVVVTGAGILVEQLVEFPVVGALLLAWALLLAMADCYIAMSCEKYVGLKDWLGAVGSRPLLTSPCLALIGWVMGLYYFLKPL